MTEKKTKQVFYFDEEKQRSELRKYGIVIDFARDIAKAIKGIGFEVNEILLRGMMQVREKCEVINPVVEIVGDEDAKQNIEYKKTYLSVTPNIMRELNEQTAKTLETIPTTLKAKYKKEIDEEIQALLSQCYSIRQKWMKSYNSTDLLTDVNFEAILYTPTPNEDISIRKSFLEEIKESCMICAQDERTEKVYTTLLNVCKELTELADMVASPELLLNVIQRDRFTNEFAPIANFNFNLL